MTPTFAETKMCTKCGNNKPLSDFNFKNKAKGLYQSRCKLCTKQISTDHYNANKSIYIERAVANNKTYRAQSQNHMLKHDANRQLVKNQTWQTWSSIDNTNSNSKVKGNVTETAVLHRLTQLGHAVLLPYGDNERYDMVVERNGLFIRIQCKTGRVRDGAVVFSAKSVYRTTTSTVVRDYNGQIEYFGIFCKELNKVYMVPVDLVNGGSLSLRVSSPKNYQFDGKYWTEDFEI